jgi:hypothetical protein
VDDAVQPIPKKSRKLPKKHWLDYATFVVEFLGLLGLCIYATLTCGLLRESKATVLEMQRQTRIDERPWIAFTAPSGFDVKNDLPVAFFAGRSLQLPIEFTNYGKTAAVKNRAEIAMSIVPMGQEPVVPDDKQTLSEMGENGPSGEHIVAVYPIEITGMGVLDPGAKTDLNISRPKITSSAAVDDPLTQDEANRLGKGQAYIAVWGRFLYSDIFGVQHVTRFCRAIPTRATLPKCANFNYVDSNDGTNQAGH